MRSKWLPTFPLHAANWLADPRVQMLSPVNKSILLESLLRSWMLGKAIDVVPGIADAYAELWPEYEVVLREHTALREKRAELGRLGNERRWSQKGSPGDRNSDPVAIANGSLEGSPGDRTRVHRTPSPSPSPTITQSLTRTRKTKDSSALPNGAAFDAFWSAYPKKQAKQDAIKAWRGVRDADIAAVFEGVEAARNSDQWRRGFVPLAATFLRGRRWEDEFSSVPVEHPKPLTAAETTHENVQRALESVGAV